MALIKCPECGKENVSDSAVACPDCGYGIKTHFVNIKELRAQEERRKQLKVQREKERQEQEIKDRQELEKMPAPKRPFPFLTLVGIFFAALAILMFVHDSPSIGVIEVIFAFILIFGGTSDYKERRRIYKLSLCDMDRAKREAKIHQQTEKMMAAQGKANIINVLNPFHTITNGIKCPMCGEYAGKKISTTNRVVSVSTVGLASEKIGKQYKCTGCGHLW